VKNLNEMFVALLVVVVASFASFAVAEENRVTTIEYENGDVYTVPENENVFVSTKDNLFIYKPYTKSIQFEKLWPTAKVDRPVPTPNPNPVGSHSWCKAHVPFATGYSFSDQAWQRFCDTNNDGQYGCGDATFNVSEDSASCGVTTTTTGVFSEVDANGFSQACDTFDTSTGSLSDVAEWEETCDTNGDGTYNLCDYHEPTGGATFIEIQYEQQCTTSEG